MEDATAILDTGSESCAIDTRIIKAHPELPVVKPKMTVRGAGGSEETKTYFVLLAIDGRLARVGVKPRRFEMSTNLI